MRNGSMIVFMSGLSGANYAVSLFGTGPRLSFVLWFDTIRPLGCLSHSEGVMARARKRRKLPTLIDRGMGLLEVILPYGDQDQAGTFLPEGQRDTGGFWYPSGYTQPGDIFTPAQRKLQDKQREVQRHRLRRPTGHH